VGQQIDADHRKQYCPCNGDHDVALQSGILVVHKHEDGGQHEDDARGEGKGA